MKTMLMFLALSGCGYSAVDSNFTAQVKFVQRVTPILCSNFTSSGLSLGVMRNGTGSVSTHDVDAYVPTEDLANQLRDAASSGSLVKVTYNKYRMTFCIPIVEITKVELIK